MKRLLVVGFIVSYLGTLNYGVMCHMLGFGVASHPLMYFIVWDMFCGWSAYDARVHIIAETEDQTYYDVATPPWGEFHPWGNIGRQHYDPLNNHASRIGFNTLKHTRHEPITRLFVIEESWAKKYNIPEAAWRSRYDEPQDVQKYYHLRSVQLADGTPVQNYSAWMSMQAIRMIEDNPRLQMQAAQSRPMFVFDHQQPGQDVFVKPGLAGEYFHANPPPVGAPLGN
jgi:hypothetical protein